MQIQRFHFRDLSDGAIEPGVKLYARPAKPKEEIPPPPPPEPTFSADDLKKAESEGYKKGFQDGIQDGRKQMESEAAEVERKLMKAMEKAANLMPPVIADFQEALKQVEHRTATIALAVARKIAGQALAGNADAMIEAIARQCFETLESEPKFIIAVHESLGDALEKRLYEAAVRLPSSTEIIILRDPDMPVGDCRVEWRHGALERNAQKLWQDVERIIAASGLPVESGIVPASHSEDIPYATSVTESEKE